MPGRVIPGSRWNSKPAPYGNPAMRYTFGLCRRDTVRPSAAAGQRSGSSAEVELTWNVAHRHSIRFVYAPLSFSGTGSFASPVRFAGSTFASGTATDSDYRFDSYRLTYRYLAYESERWRLRIGATAFIRDAKVELRQPGVTASDSDVGFVPLLSANVEYQLARAGPPWWTSMGWSPRRAAPSTRLQKYVTTSRTPGFSLPAIASLKAAWTTANVSPLVGITSPSSRSGRDFRVAFRSAA